jgi:hypothetical protein
MPLPARPVQLCALRLSFFLHTLEFAVVHHPANGRPHIAGDLHQIKTGLACHLSGLVRRHDAQGFAVVADQAHRRNADLFVDAMRYFDRLCPLISLGPNLCLGPLPPQADSASTRSSRKRSAQGSRASRICVTRGGVLSTARGHPSGTSDVSSSASPSNGTLVRGLDTDECSITNSEPIR